MFFHWSLFKAWTRAIVMRNVIVSQEMRSAVMDYQMFGALSISGRIKTSEIRRRTEADEKVTQE
jgi:hypothetical protein